MKKLSIGLDSTLGNWIALSSSYFGQDSSPTKFLINKANESPNGIDEEVIADEAQLLLVLSKLFANDIKEMGEKNV